MREEATSSDGDFEAWYAASYQRLLGSVFVVVGSRDLARDAVDEACCRALGRWPRVSKMDSPTGWTFRVAVNYAHRVRWRRALERRVGLSDRGAPVPPADFDEWAGLWDAVGRLPARQRQAILLRYVLDLPEAEVAGVMGTSRGGASASLAKARRALAGLLPDPKETGAR